jgi:hypothetical protein
MLHSRRNKDREGGQILILFELVLIVILGFVALVVDLGFLRNNRQILVNSVDAAALAGGSQLPVAGPANALKANALIAATITKDYPGLTASDYKITYKCLIGADATGPLISRDVPAVCDPHNALTHTPVAGDFKGAGPTRVSACDPALGDKCNVVVVEGSATTQYAFAPVLGVDSGSTGTVMSAACRGPCGQSPLTPVDVVLIMDRSSSMSGVDTTNAQSAANQIVSIYNPANQWLGLSLLGASKTATCLSAPASSPPTSTIYPGTGNSLLRSWVPVGLSGTGATFSTTYAKDSAAIACITNSGTGTDLADPVNAAAYELTHNGRPGVRKGIILETDGQPNAAVGSVSNSAYCLAANTAADAAKTAGIEIFTVGFGLETNPTCPDSSGAFHNKTARYLLANMATQPSVDGGCPGTSNSDGDHFFCVAKTLGATTDLTSVFQAAAQQLAKGGAHLVQLYPAPVVMGVSPTSATHLGGTTVTISGEYFTGATSVTFGGVNAASFTFINDSSMTAKTPAGTTGATVDIIVTTPGGTSFIVLADHFTYN